MGGRPAARITARPAPAINAFFEDGEDAGEPMKLPENSDSMFSGSYFLGDGFLMGTPEAQNMFAADDRLREVNRGLQSRFRAGTLKWSAQSGYNRHIPRPLGPHRLIWGDKVINVKNSGRRKTWPEAENAYVANGEIGVATGFFKTKGKKRAGNRADRVGLFKVGSHSLGIKPKGRSDRPHERAGPCSKARPQFSTERSG